MVTLTPTSFVVSLPATMELSQVSVMADRFAPVMVAQEFDTRARAKPAPLTALVGNLLLWSAPLILADAVIIDVTGGFKNFSLRFILSARPVGGSRGVWQELALRPAGSAYSRNAASEAGR